MRIWIAVCLGGLGLTGSLAAQVWEKPVAPGLVYRMELDANLPRMLHALRWNPRFEGVQARAELGGKAVFESGENQGRETLSEMVARTKAIGGINADFFPWTGDPLGLMIRDYELISMPYAQRPAFVWGKGYAEAGTATYQVSASLADGTPLSVRQFNTEVPIDQAGLFSPVGGIARAKTPNRHAILKVVSGDWRVGSTVELEVEKVEQESEALAAPEGRAILTGTGNQLAWVAGLRPGQRIRASFRMEGFDWAKASQAVAGGPTLVSKGLVALDPAAQGFTNEGFSDARHPRTAIGKTADGEIWFVTVDGRQAFSQGATLLELARVMQRLGCMEAINLDGGGSTTFNLFGQTLNRPSDGRERPVANGVVFLGPSPKAAGTYRLSFPATVKAGTTVRMQVLDATNRVVPNIQVLWSAKGSGWIDQGGFLRTTAAGTVFVTAFVGGQPVSEGIPVGS